MEINPASKPGQLEQHLLAIRNSLLHLHKALIESERETYEKTFGKIPSPNQFLKLLVEDPWFAWLRPMSQLVVAMDEALDAKEPLTDSIVNAFIKEANRLLISSETSQDASRHYFEALQRDPDVIFAHANLTKLLNPPKSAH